MPPFVATTPAFLVASCASNAAILARSSDSVLPPVFGLVFPPFRGTFFAPALFLALPATAAHPNLVAVAHGDDASVVNPHRNTAVGGDDPVAGRRLCG